MLFEDLRAFVAVIDNNSLTRAADALALTQSAVSRRIQHLEEVLGVALFDRNSRPPAPTALARRVYEQALPLMQGAGKLLAISRDDDTPSGTFRLGMTQAVAEVVLFDAVVRLRAAFPALDLRLHTEWSPSLQDRLAQGALDAIVLMMPSPGAAPPSMDGRFIDTLEVVVVQSRAHALVASGVDIAALSGQEWILNPLGCGYRAALERAMAGAGRSLRLRVDTLGTELQLRLVAAGMGLGLIPRSLLARSALADQLDVIDVAGFSMRLDVWMIHPVRMGNLKRAVAMLGDLVAEQFASYRPER